MYFLAMNDRPHKAAPQLDGIVLFSAYSTPLGSVRFGGHL